MYVHNSLEVPRWPFSNRLCELCACHVSLFGVSRGFLTLTPSPLQAEQSWLHPWPGIARELGRLVPPVFDPGCATGWGLRVPIQANRYLWHCPPFDRIHPSAEQSWPQYGACIRKSRTSTIVTLCFSRDQIDTYSSWRIQASLFDAKVESRFRTRRVVARSPH